MEYIIGFIMNIFDFFAFDNILSSFFKTYKDFKIKLIIFSIKFVTLNIFLEGFMQNLSSIKFLIVFLFNYLLFFYIYKNSYIFIILLVWQVVSASFEIFAMSSFSFIFNISTMKIMTDAFYFTILALSYSFILYLISLLFKIWKKRKFDITNISKNEIILLSIYPVINYVIIYIILYNDYLSGVISTSSWLISVALFVVTFLIFYFIGEISESNKNKQLILLNEKEEKSKKEYISAVKSAYETQRRLTHDYNREISTLQAILQLKDYSKLESYLNKLVGNSQKNKLVVMTHNTIVDAILNQKYAEASTVGVTIEFTLDNLSTLTISDEDIVYILTNSIDNAITSAKNSKDKIIQVFISLNEDNFIYVVKNSVKEKIKIINNDIEAQTPNIYHGFGLRNIRSSLSKYDSHMSIECSETRFTLSIMINF